MSVTLATYHSDWKDSFEHLNRLWLEEFFERSTTSQRRCTPTFFPFTNWRFHSPISYWDPNYYRNIGTIIEILLVSACCITLLVEYSSWVAKLVVGTLFLSYLVYGFYAVLVWL